MTIIALAIMAKKTALDLEIERELLEMMENEDPEPEKQKKV